MHLLMKVEFISILEMLSGIQPWHGKSAHEIYQLAVLKKEKAIFPYSLPSDIENVLSGCFQYDFRKCPFMEYICMHLISIVVSHYLWYWHEGQATTISFSKALCYICCPWEN